MNVEAHNKLLLAEQGALHVKTETIKVTRLFNSIKSIFSGQDCAKDIELIISPFDQDSTVVSDEDLLLRVLVNMVKNAFEATSKGGNVSISFSMQNSPVFSVKNDGEIPPDTALRIFDRTFSTKAAFGRGLGTYSMKLFGETYLKGKVTFTTDAKNGTIFSITLPKVSLIS
jgi:signal transduction histidine kinase